MTTTPQAKQAMQAKAVAVMPSGLQYVFDSETLESRSLTEWVRITVRHTGGPQDTLGPVGNRKFLRTGSLFISIFTKAGQGSARADELAAIFRDEFEGSRITGTTVVFLDVVAREQPEEGSWFSIVVEASFEYHETR